MKWMASVVLAGAMFVAPVVGLQAQQGGATAQEQELAQAIGKKLLGLTDYAVFDSLGFNLQGNNVVLNGYASRPELKKDAERAVKSVAGVGTVTNQIVELPFSPNDDRVRVAVYRRIYGYGPFRKYSGGGPLVDDPLAVAAGGITADPPMGFHAIHIIVQNGNVILTGAVDSKEDAQMAYMQANGAAGAFSVKNELNYPGKTEGPAGK